MSWRTSLQRIQLGRRQDTRKAPSQGCAASTMVTEGRAVCRWGKRTPSQRQLHLSWVSQDQRLGEGTEGTELRSRPRRQQVKDTSVGPSLLRERHVDTCGNNTLERFPRHSHIPRPRQPGLQPPSVTTLVSEWSHTHPIPSGPSRHPEKPRESRNGLGDTSLMFPINSTLLVLQPSPQGHSRSLRLSHPCWLASCCPPSHW